MRRLGDVLRHWTEHTPDSPAISDEIRSLSYAQLSQAVADCRHFLASIGVRPGDRVMLIGENSSVLAIFILAAGLDDIWVVLENARRAPLETDAVCSHAQPRRILYLTENSPSAGEHASRHKVQAVTTPFGALAIGPLMETPPEVCYGPAQDQVAALIYTTGSTGTPKGVMLTHGNLLFIGLLMQQQRHLIPEDRVYGILPITHVMGLSSGLIGTLASGAHVQLVPRFAIDHCLNSLSRDGISILQGAPAMFSRLIKSEQIQHLRTATLRVIAAGGAPLDPTLKQEVEQTFGLTLHNGYGLTEGSAICWTRLESANPDCAVGPPNPGVEIAILDPERQQVTPGEQGSLWARGPNIMKGYFRDPQRTASVLTDDGWFNTEDLARQLPDGRVIIEGRNKDLIIRSGFNVSPLEVETALNAHEQIQHSAVLGHMICGNEQIIAMIERCPGASLKEEDVRQFLQDRLSPYKRPGRIFFVDSLPVAPNGKVLKHQLKQTLKELI
ncbi:class I adenylate-forming enzyme family protein [Advenella mimigardefordensis]|uniref:AMP-dependent ligase n=1 Tax=Advenella mimigardefordensis (strain DSM 17166 / LMG 22922 / DPN7) TaxID=1247726 RepID=W0PKZ5_ADVMD|nr:class I adenylate-forming enzyme family protein [Advenella mimigardefordensis]AHG65668.1 AMP-dependent ligase [Advenella mimigardefordensis DPN7]